MNKDKVSKLFEVIETGAQTWGADEVVFVKITDESMPEFGKTGKVTAVYPDFISVDIDGKEVNVDESQYTRVDEIESASDEVKTEVSPEGWGGTVKAMKKHPEIDNPFALANYMKKKGYTPHKKED